MATEASQSPKWKQIALLDVLDGRQYENNFKLDFNKSVHYAIKRIGNYVGDGNSEFICVPKENELPKLTSNIHRLIDEDLNKGFKQTEHTICKTKSFTDVVKNEYAFDAQKAGIQFVTFRNNMNKIMAAPYFHSRSEYDAFAIDIIKKNGIIYLEIVDKSELLKKDQCNQDNPDDKVGPDWWGRRFEDICRTFTLKIKQHKEQNTEEEKENSKMTESAELITLFQSELNKHRLLMAAEIDALNDNNEFVEIKTQKYIKPKRINNNYSHRGHQQNKFPQSQSIKYSKYQQPNSGQNRQRYHPYQNESNVRNNHQREESPKIIPWYKSMKIWIQSYLGGVPNVLMGFRNDKGIVVDVEMYKLDWFGNKLSYYNKRNRQRVHKGNVCLNFADNVLTFIKTNCVSADCVYRVVFNDPWNKLILYSSPSTE